MPRIAQLKLARQEQGRANGQAAFGRGERRLDVRQAIRRNRFASDLLRPPIIKFSRKLGAAPLITSDVQPARAAKAVIDAGLFPQSRGPGRMKLVAERGERL